MTSYATSSLLTVGLLVCGALASADSSAVRMTITTPTDELAPRDALALTVEYENLTDNHLVIACGAVAGDSRLLIDYTRPGHQSKRFTGFQHNRAHDDVKLFPTRVPPRGSFKGTLSLIVDTNPDRFLLEEPGSYEIRARCVDKRVRPILDLRSNVIVVRVREELTLRGDALKSYDTDLGRLAQFTPPLLAAPDEPVLEKASQFLDEHPDHPQATRLKHGLVRVLDLKIRRHRASDAQRSLHERLKAELSAEGSGTQ